MSEQSPAQRSFTRARQPIPLSAALCLCHHLGGLGRARDSSGDPRLPLCARPPPCLFTVRAAAAGRQEEGRSAVPTCFWGTPRTSRGQRLWGEGRGTRPIPHSLCSLSPPVTRSSSSHPWVPRATGPPSSCTARGNLFSSTLATGLFLGLVSPSPVSPFSSPSPRTGPSQRVEGVQLPGLGQGVLGGEDTEAQGRREEHAGDEPARTSVLWVQGPRVGVGASLRALPQGPGQLRVSLFRGGTGRTEAPSPGGRGPDLEPPPWRDW